MVVKFEVWDPSGILDTVTFEDEYRASSYRDKMERRYGRTIRIRKIILDTAKPNQGEFVRVVLNLLPGDTVTSVNGILREDPTSGRKYIVKQFRVLGNGDILAAEKYEYLGGAPCQ